MIKGFGAFSFLFFLFLCAQIGGFGPGFVVWFLSILLVTTGTLSYSFFIFPASFESHGYSKLKSFAAFNPSMLVNSIHEIATIARKDGLFAVESIRKDVKDPWLQYSLKRMIEGFDQQSIMPVIRNEQIRIQEHLQTFAVYQDRVSGSIVLFGLAGSLSHLMAFLSKGDQSLVAASFVPFFVSILFQLAFNFWFQGRVDQWADQSRLYYSILETGISGIQNAVHADVLKEQLESRITHA